MYSIIIPVYNRPEELDELLASLMVQNYKDFEVIVVEDGSANKADAVVAKYGNQLRIQYHYKPNTGPGDSRNFGFSKAEGDFLIVFDSDCIVPPNYLQIVHNRLQETKIDAFGGPDASMPEFSNIQKAINFSMTSLLSTGGIRGKKNRIGTYQARSFNMGFSRQVYESTGGFSNLRVSEDIDLSIRIHQKGFNLELIPEAFVYHKRRTSFTQFFKQTHSFGKGRANIGKIYPNQMKIVHAFPTLFLLFCLSVMLSLFVSIQLFYIGLFMLLFYTLLVLTDALNQNKDIGVAILSIAAVYVQMSGYGTGFLIGIFSKKITGRA